LSSPSHLTRRAAMIGAAVSSAALAVPAAAALSPSEHPNDKVRRIAKEMAEALRDPEYVGFKRVTVTPDLVAHDEADGDATLFALIDAHREADAACRAAWERAKPLTAEAIDIMRSRGKSVTENWDEFMEVFKACGAEAAEDAASQCAEVETELFAKIRDYRPQTLAGLRAKFAFVRKAHGIEDVVPRDEQDLLHALANAFGDDLAAFAA
jgi:hypothetical protein